MTYAEIIAEPLDEQKPLTPPQAMARAKKVQSAQARLADAKKRAAISVAAAARKVTDI